MVTKYYMGIDTSAYTTSLSIIDEYCNVIFDLRKVLKVKKNKRGLRQQEAVFQHVNNLPYMFDILSRNIDVSKISVVSASSKPRNIEESYMPVFVVGKGQAYVISKILGIPFKQFSHQEGHIAAGMMENKLKSNETFLAFHLSGGTTELLLVKNYDNNFKIKIIGGTKDISCGQLIDRIGVKLGYLFPCGKQVDLASTGGQVLNIRLPVSVNGTWINFSGSENFFIKLINDKNYNIKDVITSLFYSISKSISNVILEASFQYGINKVLFIGGVSSNSFMRNYVQKNLYEKGIYTYFPKSKLCSDNSVGVAYLGKIKNGFIGDGGNFYGCNTFESK